MEFKADSFTLKLEGAKISFQGKIERSDYEELSNFLKKVDSSIEDDEINVDLRALEFLNSSGIRILAGFIHESKKNIRIIIDPDKTWQKVGIKPFESLKEAGRIKVTE
jgi:hypothetical protein